jgi:hypothetical protein
MEINYTGTHGSNLLMRRNIAQASLFDPANPLAPAISMAGTLVKPED